MPAPAVHCISMCATHSLPSKQIFISLFFFLFFFYTGHFAFKIDATDPENDPLTYQISGEGSEFFRMDSTTGIAVLSRPINKDVRCRGGTTDHIYHSFDMLNACMHACMCTYLIVLVNLCWLVLFHRR